MKKEIKPDDDWQRVWLAAEEKAWTSLVLVPNDASVDAQTFAESLARTGRVHAETPVRVVNGTGVQLADVQQLIETIAAVSERGERVIVSVDPLSDNAAGIAILRATSAALLLVSLGESLMTSARATIDAIGRDRLIGSVVVKSNKPSTAAAGERLTLK